MGMATGSMARAGCFNFSTFAKVLLNCHREVTEALLTVRHSLTPTNEEANRQTSRMITVAANLQLGGKSDPQTSSTYTAWEVRGRWGVYFRKRG